MRSFEKKSVNYVRIALLCLFFFMCAMAGLSAVFGFYYLIHSTGNDFIVAKAGISFVAMLVSSIIAYGIGDSLR